MCICVRSRVCQCTCASSPVLLVFVLEGRGGHGEEGGGVGDINLKQSKASERILCDAKLSSESSSVMERPG